MGPADLAAALREISPRNGLAFVDRAGAVRHELYPDAREKIFELAFRSPLAEIRRAVDKRALRSLFQTLRSFSLEGSRSEYVAGVTWEFSPETRVLRVREIARRTDLPDKTSAKALLEACGTIARLLGAWKMALQTHAAFASKLVGQGWREDEDGSALLVRLGARLQGDRCYTFELGDRSAGT